MKKVLLDANIFQYGVNSSYAAEVARVLEELKSAGYEPADSAYTSFEVYRGLSYKKVPDMKALIDEFAAADVDLVTFKLGAVLTTCYKDHPATMSYFNRYSDGDVILAASALRYGDAYILTGNGTDFPSPFFEEESIFYLNSSDGKLRQALTLKRANRETYNACMKEHFPDN